MIMKMITFLKKKKKKKSLFLLRQLISFRDFDSLRKETRLIGKSDHVKIINSLDY